MAELDLFMTEEDEKTLVQFIFTTSCIFVPDVKYPTKHYKCSSTLYDYLVDRETTRLFYIVDDNLLESPLEIRHVKAENSEFFYVSPRSGGPTLQLLGGGTYDKSDGRYVRRGSLSYYSTYWSTLSKQQVKPSKDFIARYRLIRDYLQSGYSKVKVGNAALWLGRSAREEVLAGARLVNFEDASVGDILRKLK